MALFTIKEDIPTSSELMRMSLSELNKTIDLYGKRINARITAIRRAGLEGDGSLFALEQIAAIRNPKATGGSAKSFYRGKAKSIGEARERASGIIRALRHKTSTVGGIKGAASKRKKSFETLLGMDLTWQQYNDLTYILGRTQYNQVLDSSQVVSVIKEQFLYSEFGESISDIYGKGKEFRQGELLEWIQGQTDKIKRGEIILTQEIENLRGQKGLVHVRTDDGGRIMTSDEAKAYEEERSKKAREQTGDDLDLSLYDPMSGKTREQILAESSKELDKALARMGLTAKDVFGK